MVDKRVTYGLLLYFITSTQESDGSLKLGEILSRAHLVNFFFRLLQKAVGGMISVLSNKALSLSEAYSCVILSCDSVVGSAFHYLQSSSSELEVHSIITLRLG